MSTPQSEPGDQLQSILVGAEDASEFLLGLSKLAAASISEAANDVVECAVTVKIQRRPSTAAGSSARAVELDRIEQAVGDGPCLQAMRDMTPVIVDDVLVDRRWPELNRKFADAGVHSSLGVPLEISSTASAALNFFASRPGVFTPGVYEKAIGFAAAAHSALHLSVRLSVAQNRAEDLEAAMQSRTAINLACGVIMAQNRCSQEEAMDILSRVSSNRNRKLRDVATELIEQLSGGGPAKTHFDK